MRVHPESERGDLVGLIIEIPATTTAAAATGSHDLHDDDDDSLSSSASLAGDDGSSVLSEIPELIGNSLKAAFQREILARRNSNASPAPANYHQKNHLGNRRRLLQRRWSRRRGLAAAAADPKEERGETKQSHQRRRLLSRMKGSWLWRSTRNVHQQQQHDETQRSSATVES